MQRAPSPNFTCIQEEKEEGLFCINREYVWLFQISFGVSISKRFVVQTDSAFKQAHGMGGTTISMI